MMVPAIRANESRRPADSASCLSLAAVFALSFHGVAFALNARRRAHFSKSGSSQHCVRLGVNLKLAREVHSAHIAGRLRSQAARYADLETRGLAQMPLVPEGVLRAAGAPDPAQRGAADGALCLGASGRGEVVRRSAAKLGWIVVARVSLRRSRAHSGDPKTGIISWLGRTMTRRGLMTCRG
jgi:hypothetical protein